MRQLSDSSPQKEKAQAGDAWDDSGKAQFEYREMLSRRVVGFALTTAALGTGILSLVGPIGSYESLSLLQRFVYCTVATAISWPVFYSMNVVTLYVTRHRASNARALAAALTMLIAAVPCTAVVVAYHTLFHADRSVYDGFLTLYVVVASIAVSCCLLFHFVVCQRLAHAAGPRVASSRENIPAEKVAVEVAAEGGEGDSVDSCALGDSATGAGGRGPAADPPGDTTGLGGLDADAEAAPAQLPVDSTATTSTLGSSARDMAEGAGNPSPAVAAVEARPRFLDRLPEELGHDLIYIRTVDHYLEVHTTAGSGRVLVRFADAVAELGDLGMQVHRCYWIAHRTLLEEAAELVSKGNRTVLRLAGDREVPVSRTYLPKVRAALGAEDDSPAG